MERYNRAEKTPRRKTKQSGILLSRNGLVRQEQIAPPTPAPSWKLYENPSFHTVSATAMVATAGLTIDCEAEKREREEEEDEEEDFGTVTFQRAGKMDSSKKYSQFEGLQGPAPYDSLVSALKLAAPLQDEVQTEGQGNSPVGRCNFFETSPCSHLQLRPSSFSTSESPDSVTRHVFLKRDSVQELGGLLDIHKSSDSALGGSSCGYIKAFSRFSLDNSHQDSFPCEAAYSEELQRALSRVRQVEAAQISARKDVDSLLRRCADEITMLRTKEQEKVQAAVLSIAEQLEAERQARKRAETERERLAKCVADANRAVSAAERELEKERKSRLLMEDVCNELAEKIGEDKTEVEELKRELAKARDDIEEERKAIRVTEAWREERVQMKLAEARLELEQRCTALDKLKTELQSFLSKQRVHSAADRGRSLESVFKRLHEQTAKLPLFQEDTRFQGSPDDVTLSGETHNWLEFRNAQLSEQRFEGYKQASRRRRNMASMRSYRSKTKELSMLGGRNFVEDSIDYLGRNRHGIMDSGSERESTSDCEFDEHEEAEAKSESPIGTRCQGQRERVLWSSNRQEEPESISSKVHWNYNMKGRQQQLFCGQRAAGVERHYYGGVHSNHGPSLRKEGMFATESVTELSSLTRPSPASKGHMPSPELLMGNPCIERPRKHCVSLGRKDIHSSGQSKPYKRNSLHVKLLLEDKLFEEHYLEH
ncbi:hypothetical protein L7F22_055616 [Adiantum nelumboides]|nr:hypothetical protein [Adiantum nelumboides]